VNGNAEPTTYYAYANIRIQAVNRLLVPRFLALLHGKRKFDGQVDSDPANEKETSHLDHETKRTHPDPSRPARAVT
jgi:hypothetical protein